MKIKIDAEFTEEVWQQVQFSDAFQQREPGDGEPPTERTGIGCLYDDDNLYFGIKCYDSEPEKIVRTELRRDAIVDNDDYFEMVLDTYHDNRSGFYFIFNAYGSKRDARLSDEGRNYNPDWDGIWQCKATINQHGWFAELAIPWKTLRFQEGDDIYFGANFGRMIRRKNESLYWNHISRNISGFGLFRLSEAGHIGPFDGLRLGGNIELQPFAVGGLQNDMQTDFDFTHIAEMGMDAKVNLSSNIVTDLTFNTDFAQVEADQEQVNLTRYSLYFPEKREFFLEGAEIFNTRDSYKHDDSVPTIFYSRRIGIEGNRPVPLWGGVKMTGKAGKTTIGVLNMVSRQSSFISEDDGPVQLPTTNFSVLRLKQDIFHRSTIGAFVTSKIVESNSHSNHVIAADAQLLLSPTTSVTALVAGSSTSDSAESRGGVASVDFSWRNDRYQAGVSHTEVQPNFNAEMGFVRRTDIRSTSASFTFSPRPKRFTAVRKFNYNISGGYLTDFDNHLLDKNIDFSYSINFQSSANVNISIDRDYEFLPFAWEVRPGIEIPDGMYEGYSFSTRFSSSDSRTIAMDLSLSHSDYYTGERRTFSGGFNFRNITKLLLNAEYQFNRVTLPQRTFNTFTLSNRIIYAFSTDMYIKAYIQYNSDRLRYDGRVKWNANILFRYIFRPGSDFYLVYNQEHLVGTPDELTNRTLMAKVVYFWRK
ncbi:MAG: DUF5916 domain-containing protein [Candidatus Zhuqueibacterota bacterium]